MTRFLAWLLDRRVIVPGNLVRYRLFAIPGIRSLRIYLHHFIGPDPDRALHDHPKRFTVLGLRGGYTEDVAIRNSVQVPRYAYNELGPATSVLTVVHYLWRAPWFRTFPPEHIHRISRVEPNTWTLVFVGFVVREWGFWIPTGIHDELGRGWHRWVPWREYHHPGSIHRRDAEAAS